MNLPIIGTGFLSYIDVVLAFSRRSLGNLYGIYSRKIRTNKVAELVSPVYIIRSRIDQSLASGINYECTCVIIVRIDIVIKWLGKQIPVLNATFYCGHQIQIRLGARTFVRFSPLAKFTWLGCSSVPMRHGVFRKWFSSRYSAAAEETNEGPQ